MPMPPKSHQWQPHELRMRRSQAHYYFVTSFQISKMAATCTVAEIILLSLITRNTKNDIAASLGQCQDALLQRKPYILTAEPTGNYIKYSFLQSLYAKIQNIFTLQTAVQHRFTAPNVKWTTSDAKSNLAMAAYSIAHINLYHQQVCLNLVHILLICHSLRG